MKNLMEKPHRREREGERRRERWRRLVLQGKLGQVVSFRWSLVSDHSESLLFNISPVGGSAGRGPAPRPPLQGIASVSGAKYVQVRE